MSKAPAASGREVPYWLLATVLIAIAFGVVVFSDHSYTIIFNAISKGVKITLFVTVVAFALSSVMGMIVALGSLSGFRLFREVATFYVEIIRGVPVLVLLFYIAFVGAPQLILLYNFVFSQFIEMGWLAKATVRDFDLMWRAVFALSISYSAFMAEIFRAGIQSVDTGQVEAAKALGMKKNLIFYKVVLPQAIRVILPPIGNEFIAIVKDSALVSVLGVQDITQLGKIYSSSTFLFFETYNVVAYVYLMITVSLSLMVREFERYIKRQDRKMNNQVD